MYDSNGTENGNLISNLEKLSKRDLLIKLISNEERIVELQISMQSVSDKLLSKIEILESEIKKLSINKDVMKGSISANKDKVNEIICDIKKTDQAFQIEKIKLNEIDIIIKKMQSSIDAPNIRINELNDDIIKCHQSLEKVSTNEKTFAKHIEKSNTKLLKLSRSLKSKDIILDDLKDVTLRANEFVWYVDQFKRRIRDVESGKNICIDSEPFVSHNNGYHLRLHLYPCLSQSRRIGDVLSSVKYMAVFFSLILNQNDDILEWPMRHCIKIVIRSQGEGKSACKEFSLDTVSGNDKVCFDRPLKNSTRMCGNDQFIALETLLASKSLVKNDSIFICCSVNTFSPFANGPMLSPIL